MLNADYSIVAEIVTNDTLSISDILSGTDTFTNIIVNIIVIVGGIVGLNYIRKMREKQIDATFSYLTRLNVRLKYFDCILDTYSEEIMDCFIPENSRREIGAERITLVSNTIRDFSKNAEETLKFIREENNQMPAKKGWVEKFNLFIEFLIDCEQLNQSTYCKWTTIDDFDEKKKNYYKKNVENIKNLLQMVNERQSNLENELFKKD